MLEKILINFFFIIYRYYVLCWQLFFYYIKNIVFVYYINDGKIKNITLNYYLKYNINDYKKGTYYVKIYSLDNMNHIAFKGDIDHINKITINKITTLADVKIPKRKKIILLNNEKPININLQILDNYKINMEYFKDASISNLAQIINILGLKCTHITIIELYPFQKTTIEIENVDIKFLYY